MHCKTVTKYDLDDLLGIRAVWRGVKNNAVNTEHFAIVFEFKHGVERKINHYMSSEDEQEGFVQVPMKKVEKEETDGNTSEASDLSEVETPMV